MHAPGKRVLCVLSLFCLSANFNAPAQSSSTGKTNAVQTNPLPAVSTVQNSVGVEAALLTPPSATQLFGGWVAEHFLVVEVTIGNRSREQQFVLHDIFLDYSNWKLSGIYATEDTFPIKPYQSGTTRGQISSIGALEIQEALKQNSVFSKRNFVVNGLVLLGASAGGFTFLGPPGFNQGVAGYSSSFLPAIQKFWPDRRIDQQSNVLKYGFQDKMVIAKEDPGKTYAFFPIERMLTKGLVKVYKEDPALFLNMAELYIDPTTSTKWILNRHLVHLKEAMNDLLRNIVKPQNDTALNSTVLADLLSPCYFGPYDKSGNPNGETTCAPPMDASKLQEIRDVKDIIQGFSLNSVRVVVSGVMTVDVNLVPAIPGKVDFDTPPAGQPAIIWEDLANKHTGVIYGQYLANGNPVISGITIPSGANADVNDYIDPAAAVPATSTDSELHFIVQFKKTIPPGSKLTFEVSKGSTNSANGVVTTTTGTPATTKNLTTEYNVSYIPSPPVATFDTPADLLKNVPVTGHLAGSSFDDKTIKIKSIVLDKETEDKQVTYLGAAPTIRTGSTDTRLNFTFSLKTALPHGATIILETTAKDANGSIQAVDAVPYIVK